ncbi:phosphate signaling complex protein PhoU [Methanobacterium oryzae]|uniref:phosphate signaling complex protein PhoU n=1 Tax=Methanobacterium oryzae TaxID=69540 RepID=UPI003D1C1F60
MKRYPRVQFRKRLRELKEEVEEMGQVTLKAQKNAMEILVNFDEEKMKSVKDAGKNIDIMNFELERRCMGIIAAEQPVAKDLRFIEACIKVGSHLKRMVSLAVNIANVAEDVKDEKLPKRPVEDLTHMSNIVQMMVSKGLYSFLDQNMNLARDLRQDDDKVDDLFDQSLTNITKSMFEDKDSISYSVYLLFVARFLERTADRAVSIGDRTIFMMTCEKP